MKRKTGMPKMTYRHPSNFFQKQSTVNTIKVNLDVLKI